MKNTCENCHFLAKEYREPDTGRVLSFSISEEERTRLTKGDADFLGELFTLKCQMGVWDEAPTVNTDTITNRVSATNRKDKCFFFPFVPSMMFDAAIELQKREQENYQIKRSNMYTRIGLGVASAALLINAIIGIIRLNTCA